MTEALLNASMSIEAGRAALQAEEPAVANALRGIEVFDAVGAHSALAVLRGARPRTAATRAVVVEMVNALQTAVVERQVLGS